jgi:TolA-binding protein
VVRGDDAVKDGGVDPAAKQLQATHGLFKRGLYKEAADEYGRFLNQYGSHSLATEARYGLAVAQFRQNEYAKAVGPLIEALKDPKFAQRDEALAVLGHCYLSLGEHAKALGVFDEILAQHAKSRHAETAAINRVQVLYLADRKREALEAADAFLDQYAQSGQRATALYFRALSQQALGKNDAAEKSASEILQGYPGSPYEFDARLMVARGREGQGKLDDAMESYQQAIRSAPKQRAAEARYGLGAVLYKSGKYDAALREFSAVLKDSSDSPVAAAALLQMGLTQVALGQYQDARKSLEAVASADPARAPSATYGLVQADLAEKKFDAALSRLDQLSAAKTPPVEASRLAFDRGVALMGLERFEDAARQFEGLSKERLDAALAADVNYRRAYCLHRLGKHDESHQLLARVGKDAAVGQAASELDAENLFLMGKYDEARAAYERLAKSTDQPQQRDRYRLRLGQTAYFAGKYDDAIRDLAPLAQSAAAAQDGELAKGLLLLGDAMLQTGKNQDAAAVLAKYAPVAQKDLAEARFKLALAQLRSGDDQLAEQNLFEVSKAAGDSPWVARALFEYGQLQFTKKRHDRAGEALRKVLQSNPPEELAAPAAYMLAWIDLDAKKYAEAASGFEAVAAKYPKHALAGDATYQRAVALREAGQAERAAEVFNSYLKNYPDGAQVAGARQMIASSLTKAGKPQEAVRILAALAGDAKTRSDAVLYELAWAQRNTSDENSAVAAYRQILELYPQSKLLNAVRAELGDLLFKQGQHAEAAQHLEKVVDAEGLDAKTLAVARYRLASAYEKLKEWKKAGAAFGRFVKDHPDDELAPSALFQAAEASIAAGRLTDAQQHLLLLVKKNAKSETTSVAMLKLGEVQAELGDHDAAGRTYQEFLDKFRQDKFAYLAQFGVGWSLENRKKYDDARKAYEKVTAAHNGPTAARAQFQIGETYFAQGKFEDAVKALLAVEDVYGKTEWSPRALYEAGRALEQLQQPEKAKQQYAAVIEKYKDAPEAALAQKALKAMGG